MRALQLCRLLCACGLAGLVLVARADDELQRLRQQNAELQARVKSLERACTTAAASPAPANAPAPAAPAPVPAAAAPAAAVIAAPPPASVPIPSSAPAAAAASPVPAAPAAPIAVVPAAPSPAAAPAAVAPPSYQAPPGYKLVKIDPEATAEDQENCATALFKNTKDAPWKHQEAWQALYKQMQPAEVESVLGQHHTKVVKGTRTLWEYGRCGTAPAQAYVVFEGKDLLYWQQPDF